MTPSRADGRSASVRLRSVLRLLVLLALHGGILLAAGGDARWPAAWVYLGVWGLGAGLSVLALSPELLEERSGLGEGAKRWDIPLAVGMAHGPVLILLVAGLDHRHGWPPSPGPPAVVAGLVAVLGGQGLTFWAMKTNAFFAPVCRIQTERGHRVVLDGPYRFVRHPGYAGAILFYLGAALLLESVWALGASGCVAIATVARTAREDRTLATELPGYGAYRARVGSRLIPGVW